MKYKIVEKKHPDGDVLYHGIAPIDNVLELEDIIELIEQRCSLTGSDVKAALDALQDIVADTLADGGTVRMGDLGTFRTSLHTWGAPTPEEFDPKRNILSAKVIFHPSRRIARDLDVKRIKFRQIK